MSDAHLRELIDLERIRTLKARYCRYVDTKQWDKLATLFVPGTRFEGFGSVRTGGDEKEFVAGITQRLAKVVSIHHVHMPEIAFTGPDTARGSWAMMDYLEFPADAVPREAPGSRGFVGWGRYEEEYRRKSADVGDDWQFSFMRLTRQRIDPLPADHPALRDGLLAASNDWLEKGR